MINWAVFGEAIKSDPPLTASFTPASPVIPNKPSSPYLLLLVGLVAGTMLSIAGYVGYQYLNLKNKVTLVPPLNSTPSPISSPDLTADWETYTSPRFRYSFRYPRSWDFFPFNENDPQILYGSHSLSNYSLTEVEKYMDHGIVDWKTFLGNKPAIKIDISVADTTPQLFPEEKDKLPVSHVTIGDLPTTEYSTQNQPGGGNVHSYFAEIAPNQTLSIVLLYQNVDSFEKLTQSAEWKTLSQILSTFKFTPVNADSVSITSPQPNAVITSPVMVKGEAPKGWSFEASLPIYLEDSQHSRIAGGGVMVTEIPGTERVSFNTTITFPTQTGTGYITVNKDNPSGLPENAGSFSIPVNFGQ